MYEALINIIIVQLDLLQRTILTQDQLHFVYFIDVSECDIAVFELECLDELVARH